MGDVYTTNDTNNDPKKKYEFNLLANGVGMSACLVSKGTRNDSK